jgi:hypothetical protein
MSTREIVETFARDVTVRMRTRRELPPDGEISSVTLEFDHVEPLNVFYTPRLTRVTASFRSGDWHRGDSCCFERGVYHQARR